MCSSLAGSMSSPCSKDTLVSGTSTGSKSSLSCGALRHCSSVGQHSVSAKDEHPPMGSASPQNVLSSDVCSTSGPCGSDSLYVSSSSTKPQNSGSSGSDGADACKSGTSSPHCSESSKSCDVTSSPEPLGLGISVCSSLG